MRRLALSLAAVALVLVAVPAQAQSPGRATVLAKDNFFKPKKVTIKKGGRVTWRWRGSNPHNVAIKRPKSSKVVRRSAYKTSGKFTHRFRRVGTWRVLCEIHPNSMRMRVVVKRR